MKPMRDSLEQRSHQVVQECVSSTFGDPNQVDCDWTHLYEKIKPVFNSKDMEDFVYSLHVPFWVSRNHVVVQGHDTQQDQQTSNILGESKKRRDPRATKEKTRGRLGYNGIESSKPMSVFASLLAPQCSL